MTEQRDYKDTVFLPKTDFPMKAGLPQKEPGILAKWEADGMYHRLREARAGREKFILHDGPPYANGDMHIGHALNHILKDMVCRTQSLLGKDAPYVPGWDCHGLPIEWKVEEQYRKKKLNKDEVPVKEFRAECRAYAQKWVDVQREQVKRLGVLGNWDKPYLTMDFDSEATIVSELLKFADSGQLYRGAKPVMWSPVEKTALAEAEVEYEDIVSTQIDVAFEIVESPNCPALQDLIDKGEKVHAVIWTTTPWTIPVNQAIAYGADVEYQLYHIVAGGHPDYFDELAEAYKYHGTYVLIASGLNDQFRSRLESEAPYILENDGDQSRVIPQLTRELGWKPNTWFTDPIKGSDLAGTMVRHPMHALGGFFAKPRPMLDGSSFVTTETGTGLVHMAPDHGEDDFDLCKANDIEPQFAVEGDGKYRADWGWLGGAGSVINPKFNAPDGPICSDLREAGGLLAASADYKHSYPHSWRSKAKVIYRCTPQWFVPMDREQAPSASLRSAPPPEGEDISSATLPQSSPLGGGVGEADGGGTLRQRAMSEINRVRWVPEKGKNRINSMVEGRPDWVLSRQRAWGVPITLFVDRKSGQYLCDPAVNARIVAAIKAEGVDAWEAARAQEYLGDAYNADDYEQVFDILDVWFDSGCTHVFTLESGKWPELSWPADLYLEGSDQHRGWFQSSLLQSCGTRGRAPYDTVLTHGFTMDQKGLKMSKSVGNTVDPLKVMETNGADIIRLWALSVDYTEDHRIGDEILKGVADQYRKLRNTFRYMLGALDGFSDAEKVAVEGMPELERYVLHLLADMDAKLKVAVDDYDFNTYVRLLADFANEDLSAFFFDIRKDCLYCDAPTDPKRMAYRTVLDILFHAMVRYAAPVLVFTAEEVWGTRFPDADSVHFLEWPEVDAGWHRPLQDNSRYEDDMARKWGQLREFRRLVNERIEPMRRDKVVGSSLECEVEVWPDSTDTFIEGVDLAELFIASSCNVVQFKGAPLFLGAGVLDVTPDSLAEMQQYEKARLDKFSPITGYSDWIKFAVTKSSNQKCGRCWRHLPEVTEVGALCGRCDTVLNA
ncbi:isoleucine--tRNA ligase [Sphingorhabdus sp.]|uniref:isoleucine--tRNA ligase n=1 Tax=Sphingorhabdus sp. TaxID=1902408 RepID=UPI0032B8421D